MKKNFDNDVIRVSFDDILFNLKESVIKVFDFDWIHTDVCKDSEKYLDVFINDEIQKKKNTLINNRYNIYPRLNYMVGLAIAYVYHPFRFQEYLAGRISIDLLGNLSPFGVETNLINIENKEFIADLGSIHREYSSNDISNVDENLAIGLNWLDDVYSSKLFYNNGKHFHDALKTVNDNGKIDTLTADDGNPIYYLHSDNDNIHFMLEIAPNRSRTILLNPATKELFDSPQDFNSPWWNIDSKSLSIQ